MTTIQVIVGLATITGTIIAAIALLINANAFRLNAQDTRVAYWLKLEDMFSPYDDIHKNLRPGGDWGREGGPRTREEWARLEEYLGVFERTKVLIDLRLIDRSLYKMAFYSRLANIVGNPTIVKAKLHHRGRAWEVFIQLLRELEVQSPWYTFTSQGIAFHLPEH